MNECVKCGHMNQSGVSKCQDCTWPMSIDAWQSTNFVIHRITIDTSCINAHRTDSGLNQLEKYQSEGRILLQRADIMLEELRGIGRIQRAQEIPRHPDPWLLEGPGRSELGNSTVLGGPDFEELIRPILFPTTAQLNDNQQRDVEHLRSHVMAGADIFVTLNTQDFINRNKQQQLMELGVWVYDPAKFIEFLVDSFDW